MLEAMTADTAALHTFWKEQEKLGGLPAFFKSFDWETELPIPWNLHGDAAPYTEVDSLKVVSMRCPLSSRAVEHSQLCLAVLPKQLDCIYNNLQPLLATAQGYGLESPRLFSIEVVSLLAAQASCAGKHLAAPVRSHCQLPPNTSSREKGEERYHFVDSWRFGILQL